MSRKPFSAMIMSLLVLSALALAFNVQPVRASGTIYIRADGSIDPSTSPILTVENVTYTLAGNLNDTLVVERNSIVIDGAGYSIKGTADGLSRGIDLSYRSNVTVENLELEGFRYCIYLYSSSGNSILGNNITGDIADSSGITLSNSSNNFILENNIEDCYSDGILSYRSSNNILSDNNITNDGVGFDFSRSSNNSLSRNAITNSYCGIDFYLSTNNTLSENNITNNNEGIWLEGTSTANNVSGNNIESNSEFGVFLSSPNNVFRKNSISNNGENLLVSGSNQDFWNDIDTSNTVNGKPVCYWVNESDRMVPLEAGYVGLVNCTDITVQGLNLSGNGIILLLVSTSNSTIKENNITDSSDSGIELFNSSNNTILYNNITAFAWGIQLSSSFGNSIQGNNIESNNMGCIILESSSGNSIFENDMMNSTSGIDLRDSSHNSIFSNSLANNSIGIYLEGGIIGPSDYDLIYGNNLTENDDGIAIFFSEGNILSGNIITANRGVGLFLYSSSNNIIFQNVISNNSLGVYFLAYYGDGTRPGYFVVSSNNTFCHNNFINNTEQVDDYAWHDLHFPTSINKWDLGYPSGGNYWSDYDGTDFYSGLYQNEMGTDGIGDTPYTIDAHKIDNYPLMYPYVSPPLQASITPVSQVSVGESLTIDSTVTGGEFPYSYQWFLNGTAIPGATASSWDFAPTEPVNCTVYLNVTDVLGNNAVSNEVSLEVHEHDAAVVDVVPQSSWIYEGGLIRVNVTIVNNGDVSDQVFITLYYDIAADGQVSNTTINLGPAQSTVLTFSWNTTDVLPYQNYTLTAKVETPHDYKPSNNQADSTSQVRIRLQGDVNYDGKVDMRDISIAAHAFGSTPDSLRWNGDADVTGPNGIPEGKVDLRDIALVAKHFGEHYP